MILYINTKDQKQVSVALWDIHGKVIMSLSQKNKYGSQVLLPLIIKLLQEVPTKDTENPQVSIQIHPKGVHVETGPGSFTGLRIGVSVANALGFALGIPVNGKKAEMKLKY